MPTVPNLRPLPAGGNRARFQTETLPSVTLFMHNLPISRSAPGAGAAAQKPAKLLLYLAFLAGFLPVEARAHSLKK